jgi:hypothetical protein
METSNSEECRIFDEGYGYDGTWCPCSKCQKSLKKIEAKKSKSIGKVTPEDKKHLTEYVINWAKQYKGMKILFISLGASSWADGRATENSDYDLYIVYEGYDKDIQVSDLKHTTTSKNYEIDIQGHPKEEFEELIEQCDEIPIFNLEGARSNPEQLLVYLADDYTLYEPKSFESTSLRDSFSRKITQVVGKKQGKSSKARHKFFNPKSDDDYIKGMKCFYFAWKITLYAIQLAKSENGHHIVDFYEPYAFWERLRQIPKEIIHSKEGYDACWDALNEFEFKAKFKEFQKLAPK